MTSYNRFASIYDVLMNDFDYEQWTNYIELIFERYNIKPKDILEMACGTGNLTINLAKRNYNIIGFDLSDEMLSKAYEKLSKFKNVELLKLNMSSFNINQKFDSIISICDSINYITEEDELYKTFLNVYNHLNEHGIFIFDINSYYKLKNIIGNNIFVEDRDDVFYIWDNFYDEDYDLCEFYLTFFVSENGEIYERYDEEHIEKAYRVDEVIELLKKAGFSKIDYYEAFTFENINDKTERINFIAIK